MLLRLVPVPIHRQRCRHHRSTPRTRTHSAADVVCSPPFSSPHIDLVRFPTVPGVMSPSAVRPQPVPYRDGHCGAAASPSCRLPRSPRTWALAAAAVAIFGAAAVVRPAAAHSFLTHPLPAWEAVAGCRVGGTPGFMYNCRGPCPNAGGYGLREGLDEAHPTAVWARGEPVEIRWARYVFCGGGRVGGRGQRCLCRMDRRAAV